MSAAGACLDKTELLDYDSDALKKIVGEREWRVLDTYERIDAVYSFVRNEIPFGFNEEDNMRASAVFNDGYGQSNTKSILLMALLRSVDVPCRLHAFTIEKKVHQGLMPGALYNKAPESFIHTWVEVFYDEKWIPLEGVVIDNKYLKALQHKFKQTQGLFCGYGVADLNFQNPDVLWNGNPTYIQKEVINHDLGTFNSPDAFFRKYPQNQNKLQKLLFLKVTRGVLNQNIRKIRETKGVPEETPEV